MKCSVAIKIVTGGCLTWQLIVAIAVGRFCWTMVAVSPGHCVKWLLIMAVMHVDYNKESKLFCTTLSGEDGYEKINCNLNIIDAVPLVWTQRISKGSVVFDLSLPCESFYHL